MLRELRGFPGLDDCNMSSRGIELESLDQRSVVYVAHYLKLLSIVILRVEVIWDGLCMIYVRGVRE